MQAGSVGLAQEHFAVYNLKSAEGNRPLRAQRRHHLIRGNVPGKTNSMALYKIDIEKSFGTEFWTNVYYTDQGSITVAAEAMNAIAANERNIHSTEILFTKGRVSSVTEGDDQFLTVPYGSFGLRVAGGSRLPLFNVARVDISTLGLGRPSRKYYRLPLYESDVDNGVIGTTLLELIEANVGDIASDIEINAVDVDGQNWQVATAFPTIGMRQLRRGSRRRSTPVL